MPVVAVGLSYRALSFEFAKGPMRLGVPWAEICKILNFKIHIFNFSKISVFFWSKCTQWPSDDIVVKANGMPSSPATAASQTGKTN